MSDWNVNSNLVPREVAIEQAKAKARAAGYQSFKVFYNGQIVATPSSLPEQVDMSLLRVSAVMDQA